MPLPIITGGPRSKTTQSSGGLGSTVLLSSASKNESTKSDKNRIDRIQLRAPLKKRCSAKRPSSALFCDSFGL